jgi:hypothetical protein
MLFASQSTPALCRPCNIKATICQIHCFSVPHRVSESGGPLRCNVVMIFASKLRFLNQLTALIQAVWNTLTMTDWFLKKALYYLVA